MVQNQIRSLFLLFAGEEELPDAVQPVLDEAVLEVQQALKDGADEDDARLNWLAAAVAFLRYTEITAASDSRVSSPLRLASASLRILYLRP